MKRRTIGMLSILCAVFIVVLANFLSAQDVLPEKEREEFIKEYSPIADEALKAYNEEDFKEFYKNFAKRRFARSEVIFRSTWIKGYEKGYGKLLSKELDLKGCSFNMVSPFLYYKAKFEKNDKAEIKVIFVEEGDTYKIFHVRFDPHTEGGKLPHRIFQGAKKLGE
ncbi:MAG: hypothetical protein HQ594_03520 [Candidatus Omnitrophica bacterium]|nr:hypothetical protein [Candidatus Omnitrophota bacterium]